MSTLQEKQLGQARENSTDAVSVYSPATNVTGIIKTITISNTSGVDATFRLFQDDDGTTYDENTALFWDIPLLANTVAQINGFYPMNNSAGNFAYSSSVANALTITLGGAEITAS